MRGVLQSFDELYQRVESLINEGETEEAKKVLASLRDKAQELRVAVSKDEQVLRELTISVNRQKDMVEHLDINTLTLYSKLIHSEKGSSQYD